MEVRKEEEIKYYDKNVSLNERLEVEPEGFKHFLLSSYGFLADFLKEKCRDKKILDYGCGKGVHSIWLAQMGGDVTGIDLSQSALEIALKRAEVKNIEDKIKFLAMDCEDLKFPDNSFDIVFDRGTFSSLDLDKILPGLARVLKSDGFLIGIETLGHNPFTNFKRKINRLVGWRTQWAESHIFKMEDFKKMEKYFSEIEIHFFHPISWITFPFLRFPGGKLLLKVFEQIDRIILALPLLKKLSFKVVFILKNKKTL